MSKNRIHERYIVKDRVCKACGKTLRMDAYSIKDHGEWCARLKEIGLEAPGGVELA